MANMQLVIDNTGQINGDVVAALLQLRNATQEDVAAVIDVKPSGVTRRMKGETKWSATDVGRIAKMLSVPVDTFYLSTDEAVARLTHTAGPEPERDMPVTRGYLQLVGTAADLHEVAA